MKFAIALVPLAVLSALGLAACEPKTQTAANPPAAAAPAASAPATPAPTQAAAGCMAHAQQTWAGNAGKARSIEAVVTGPTCALGVVLLVVRDPDQTPIYDWSGITAQIFGLAEAEDAAAMTKALAEWIDPGASQFAASDQLPDWDKTAGQKKPEEFPFHPDAALDKAGWEALRKDKAPVFCFPQGMESLNCVALRDGAMETIGLQQFPG